jgi:Thiamine pyrophosphate-requiring enzymes [acetolactate synthase, pyruvate dehydrogenase (cytochrome), glyoxylate carboligase, phosphonopyruvate decarboxylase]
MHSSESSRSRSGGRILVDALKAHGAAAVFCVPGESFLGLLDALHDERDSLPVVVCRHEHGAAMMAEACGKLTGRPGICAVTRAPGACNAAIGVHTAFQDSTPMLLIAGQVRRAFRGREAFQEVDLVAMFRPLAKHVVEVENAAEIAGAAALAFRLATTGRQGPVVLVIPEDVFREEVVAPDARPLRVARRTPDPQSMAELVRRLAASERPLMLLGGSGWTVEARAGLLAFAERQSLPVCCSFRRNDLIDNRSRCFVGELGLSPNPRLLERWQAADLRLVVGARLGEATTQGYTLLKSDQQPFVHVHSDASELGRVFAADVAIEADMPEFIAAARMLDVEAPPERGAWLAATRRDYLMDRRQPSPAKGLDLCAAMSILDERLPKDAIITVDAGNFSGWPQRFLSFGGGRRFLGPTNGAMGYAVPAAVAAQLLHPGRMVVGCVGDGGFGMTGQELATAACRGLKPLILAFDNHMFGTIRMHQERAYPGRPIGTDLGAFDIAGVAQSFGAWSERVETTAGFASALERALAADRAAVIVLSLDPEQISTRVRLADLHPNDAWTSDNQ